MGLLDGKVVIVTGGGHGIGKAYCLAIAREGGTAVVADIDDKAVDGVAKAIKDSGGKALATQIDVANFASCQEMAKIARCLRQDRRLGQQRGDFHERASRKGQLARDHRRSMGPDDGGQCQGAVAVQPGSGAGMQKRKQGSVVNISSNMAFNGGLTMMHYVTSKAAVVGFSRVLARELGPDNIRVNTLAPGATMSEEKATDEALKNYSARLRREFSSGSSSRRLGWYRALSFVRFEYFRNRPNDTC